MSPQTELWFQRWREVPDAAYRLICFPHAGGSASFFRPWQDHFPEAQVLAVRYPGRAERIEDPLAKDLRALAQDIAAAVDDQGDQGDQQGLPLVFFGHSMGAPIALETGRALEAAGLPVAHLFASGSRDAPLPEPTPATDDEETVIEQLVARGGTSREMLDDDLFRELVLPYILGDDQMFHSYRMSAEPLLNCPVTVLTGDQDEDADRRPWSSLTTRPVTQVSVRGGHFYLTEEPPYELVRTALGLSDANTRTLRTPHSGPHESR
ncbi:thioesterase II family protein [Streptomyces diastaticus]|uniref:thioesterase II family protein n=1 Tax=Streptomyces diastaticus TaxID=1956 RepID=UPI003656959C